jgi:hypothetical protein
MSGTKDTFARQMWLNFGITFTAIVGAGVALFFILSDVHAHAALIAKSQATVAARNNNLSALAKLGTDAPAAAVYGTAIAKLLPSLDDLIQFPRQIQAVGASYNVVAQASFTGEPGTLPPIPPASPRFPSARPERRMISSHSLKTLKRSRRSSSSRLIPPMFRLMRRRAGLPRAAACFSSD